MDAAGIPALQDAIRHMHGVESKWFESVEIDETFEGAQVWKGEVQVFELVGHAKASLCYAWSEAAGGERRRFFAALRVPPVNGAVAAVRASIAADANKVRN
jgi:hypothetical protein